MNKLLPLLLIALMLISGCGGKQTEDKKSFPLRYHRLWLFYGQRWY